jgi:hypothetical protein
LVKTGGGIYAVFAISIIIRVLEDFYDQIFLKRIPQPYEV